MPAITKVMVLHDLTMSTIGLKEATSSARGLGLEILVGEVADYDKVADIFAEAVRQNVNGVAGLASPFFNFNRKRLIDLCSQYRLPSIWEAIAYTRDGGLIYPMVPVSLICTADLPDMWLKSLKVRSQVNSRCSSRSALNWL